MTSLRLLLLMEVRVVDRGRHDGNGVDVPAVPVGLGEVRHGDVRGRLLRGGGRRVEPAVSALGHRCNRRRVLKGHRLLGNNSSV